MVQRLGTSHGGSTSERGKRLLEVTMVMGRLGLTSFGGPAGHIALMEHEAVERRGWVSRDRFLDMVAISNLIPGPNATEMALLLGHIRARWLGLFLAGAVFILPGALLSALLAWVYVTSGTLPSVQTAFRLGIHPVVLAIILTATWRLGRSAIRDWACVVWGTMGLGAELAGVNPTWTLLLVGAAALGLSRLPWLKGGFLAFVGLCGTPSAGHISLSDPTSVGLFFLKVGALLFGSGMVLYAFVEKDIVGAGLLTSGQLSDAIAVGQMTPGPVLSSVTFIGWLLAGPFGAAAATVGVFLPAFAFVSFVAPNFDRIRRIAWVRQTLSGVSAAVVGIMLGMAVRMALTAVWDGGTGLLFTAAFLLLLARLPTWAVVLLGAGVGFVRLL